MHGGEVRDKHKSSKGAHIKTFETLGIIQTLYTCIKKGTKEGKEHYMTFSKRKMKKHQKLKKEKSKNNKNVNCKKNKHNA